MAWNLSFLIPIPCVILLLKFFSLQERDTTAKNLETENFKDSDTGNESEYSASAKKGSRLKSNCGPNKRLASFKGLAHLREVVYMFFLYCSAHF